MKKRNLLIALIALITVISIISAIGADYLDNTDVLKEDAKVADNLSIACAVSDKAVTDTVSDYSSTSESSDEKSSYFTSSNKASAESTSKSGADKLLKAESVYKRSAVSSKASSSVSEVTQKNRRTVLGFATKYYSTDKSSYNSIKKNSNTLDEVVTFSYVADKNGNLTGEAPLDQLSLAKVSGIKTYALVHNYSGSNFDKQKIKALLQSDSARRNLANNLLNVIAKNGYDGVNIDFENIDYRDRQYYSLLIKELKDVLSSKDYRLTVSIPAKTVDNPNNSWNGAFDYKVIGAYADEVLLMTYDEHGTWGAQGPIASIGWVEKCIEYAVTSIPKNKILLGLAAYGYEWSQDGNRALSLNAVNNLISRYGGNTAFDSISKSPEYVYYADGVKHTIWFENAKSISYKLKLVDKYDLRGIGIWRLGLEDSKYFDAIKDWIR